MARLIPNIDVAEIALKPERDVAHPRPDLDRFVTQYRKAGGRVELELYEGEEQGFIKSNWGSPNSTNAMGAESPGRLPHLKMRTYPPGRSR